MAHFLCHFINQHRARQVGQDRWQFDNEGVHHAVEIQAENALDNVGQPQHIHIPRRIVQEHSAVVHTIQTIIGGGICPGFETFHIIPERHILQAEIPADTECPQQNSTQRPLWRLCVIFLPYFAVSICKTRTTYAGVK